VAFSCPACQTQLDTADRCPNCGFTGGDTMQMFTGPIPEFRTVNDQADLLDTTALKQVERARIRLARRFPQFRFRICTVNLPAETNLRLYGFWILNVHPIQPDESESDRLWTVLLLINAAANKAAVVPGYAAEPWLGNDQWDKALSRMVPAWKLGDYGRAIADFLGTARGLLEISWRHAASVLSESKRR
jgi:hypothetical protein